MNPVLRAWWAARRLVLKFTDPNAYSGERVYPTFPDENFRSHVRVYQFMGQFVPGKTVLDIGCGTGYGAHYFLTQGATSVSGIDYSDEAIEYARNHYPNERLQFREMNAEDLSFPDAMFDVVTSSENLEHLEHPEKCIEEIRRVLKPGGIMVLGTPNKEISSPGNMQSSNRFHVKEFTFEELLSLLRDHFEQVHIFENTLPSPFEAGRMMKEDRRRRGNTGLEIKDTTSSVELAGLKVNLTYLANTHSFMAIAW